MLRFLSNKMIMVLVSLTTILGLAVHDTKLDTFTVLAVVIPTSIATFEGAHMLLQFSDAHTHVERVSLSNAAAKSTSLAPWLTRNNDDRYRRGRANRGSQPFEDYHLPLNA